MSSNTNNSVVSRKSYVVSNKTVGRKIILAVCGLFLYALILGAGSVPPNKIFVKKLKNGHYQLIVDKRPYVVKGVCYSPIPVGQNHEYDWWSDPNKPWITDGKLMKEMGINTIRIYQAGENPEAVKRVLKDFYELYGIRVIMGHWLGFWEYPCPFYGDRFFQERIKKEVLEMVKTYKDEPGILFWALGNENNYSCLRGVNVWPSEEVDKEPDPQKQKAIRARIYYSFINELSKQIHQIDRSHPVALGNGELVGLEYAKDYAPDVDLVACIIYRGKTFGNLFNSLKSTFDKPIVLAEFGADAYDAYLKKEDQNMQAFFLESQWRQVYQNLANVKDGAGNCLGGTMFEWSDEWWKHDENNPDSWKIQDTGAGWSNGSYYFDIKAQDNKNMNEEWFGIVYLSQEVEAGLNPRTNSEDKPGEKTIGAGVNRRIPRKAYYVIREFWKNPVLEDKNKRKVK